MNLKMTLASMVLGVSVSAVAAPSVSTKVDTSGRKGIHAGNIMLGGGFSAGSTTAGGKTSSSTNLYPSAEYFFWDKISLGGSISVSSSESVSTTTIGPSGTYYFYDEGQIAGYVSQGLGMTSGSGSSTTSGTTGVGAKYFFNPFIAFGVGLNTTYDLGNAKDKNSSTNLLGLFSIYL